MHRNSQKRIYNEYSTYFVTTNTYERYPYFKDGQLCELFIDQIKIIKSIKKFDLFGFVILYDHIHLLIHPDLKVANISEILRSLKSNFSRDVNDLAEGAVPEPRLHGGQYSRKMDKFYKTVKLMNYNQDSRFRFFKWHKSFHDHVIRNESDFKKHLNYIDTNHLKHDLPHDWKYTGYNYSEMIDL